MKKTILWLLLTGMAFGLKAQAIKPINPADSLQKLISGNLFKLKTDNLNILALPPAEMLALNTTQTPLTIGSEGFYSKMPIVVLPGKSKMPVVKLGGLDNMPVKKISRAPEMMPLPTLPALKTP